MTKYGGTQIQQLAATDPIEISERITSFRGMLAFDIGANCGQVAHLLAPRFTRVISVEPNKQAFERLQTGAEPNVTAVEAAVTDVPDRYGTVKLDVQDQHVNKGQFTTFEGFDQDGHGWGTKVGEVRVRALTLQGLGFEYGYPDFIKIDVEGHEVRVIKGGLDMISAHKPDLFIEVHRKDLGFSLADMLDPVYNGLEVVRHPHFGPDDWGYDNHYWQIWRDT